MIGEGEIVQAQPQEMGVGRLMAEGTLETNVHGKAAEKARMAL